LVSGKNRCLFEPSDRSRRLDLRSAVGTTFHRVTLILSGYIKTIIDLYQKYDNVNGYLNIIQYDYSTANSILKMYPLMEGKTLNLRDILAANIKKQREKLGITQEKLAEKANISAAMMNDIEGCRTWISDKTLKNLSLALGIETYRLFIPEVISAEAIPAEEVLELTRDLQEMLKNYNAGVEKIIQKRGFLFDKLNK
jgi:transcriptional regulator with XRE-family HTH domain